MFNTHNIKFDNNPFDHWIIDDFLDIEDAKKLSNQFIDYDSSQDIVHYHDWIAEKKACNSWNRFPPLTYKTFSNLLSLDFVSRLSEITGITPLYPDIGLHGGGVVIAQANSNSGSSSDSPNFKVDFTVPSADINQIKRDGARQGFNVGAGNETGSYISPSGASGILIASCFGNYYWGFATKIYHISIYGSYGNNSDRAVSLNQLHSYSAAGHGSSNAHITLSVQSVGNNGKYTPKLRATFGGDYWSSNYLVVTYVGSGVASYANLRSLSHINSEITGQDTAWK